MALPLNIELWYGDPASRLDFLQKRQAIEAKMLSGDEPPDDAGFQVHGNIAVHQVKGSLTNTDSFWNSFFGVSSYNSIRNSLITASNTEGVDSSIIVWDSPGGTPKGLSDAAAVIRTLNAKGHPVYSYAEGSMTSAAYGLGSAAMKIYANPMSSVGSIGTIAIHSEDSKLMQQMGITETVIASGKFKGMGNSSEPLSEDARAYIMDQIMRLTDAFHELVATNRGMTIPAVVTMAQEGKVYIGKQALQAGLVDGIMSLDELVHQVQSNLFQNQQKTAGMAKMKANTLTPKLLTESDIALIAGGMTPEQAAAIAPTAPATPAGETPDPALAAPPTTPEPPPVPAAPAATSESDTLVAYLKTALAEANEKIIGLTNSLNASEAKLVHLQPALEAVALHASRMSIPLRIPPVDYSKMSPEMVLASHTHVLSLFQAQFQPGMKSIPAQDKDDETHAEPPSAEHRAKLAAVKLQPRKSA